MVLYELDLSALPSQELGALMSVGIAILLSFALVASHFVNGEAPLSLRLALLVGWLLSVLRVYSATSFLWGSTASDAGVFPVLRLAVLSAVTISFIVAGALAVTYVRLARHYREDR